MVLRSPLKITHPLGTAFPTIEPPENIRAGPVRVRPLHSWRSHYYLDSNTIFQHRSPTRARIVTRTATAYMLSLSECFRIRSSLPFYQIYTYGSTLLASSAWLCNTRGVNDHAAGRNRSSRSFSHGITSQYMSEVLLRSAGQCPPWSKQSFSRLQGSDTLNGMFDRIRELLLIRDI